MNQPGAIHVHVSKRNGEDLVEGWFSTVDAIHALHNAIAQLRLDATPAFDPSFGEQPRAILAPSAEELAQTVAQL